MRNVEIDEIYVHPHYRTDGIGHKLVDQLLDEASARGITRSMVYSASKEWETIVGFYEKHGFKMWFVEMYR
jgi:ribosomal protein S18 acetylase RimI-like enzyme